MNCFNHPHSSAVGICRVCCRGVCSECAVDLGHSLACNGTHEDDASAINALALRSTKLLKATRKSMFVAPIFFGVCGLVFLVEGLSQEVRLNFASFLGAAFVVFGLAILVTHLRAYGGKIQIDR